MYAVEVKSVSDQKRFDSTLSLPLEQGQGAHPMVVAVHCQRRNVDMSLHIWLDLHCLDHPVFEKRLVLMASIYRGCLLRENLNNLFQVIKTMLKFSLQTFKLRTHVLTCTYELNSVL